LPQSRNWRSRDSWRSPIATIAGIQKKLSASARLHAKQRSRLSFGIASYLATEVVSLAPPVPPESELSAFKGNSLIGCSTVILTASVGDVRF
jgi:hypothetical protein